MVFHEPEFNLECTYFVSFCDILKNVYPTLTESEVLKLLLWEEMSMGEGG